MFFSRLCATHLFSFSLVQEDNSRALKHRCCYATVHTLYCSVLYCTVLYVLQVPLITVYGAVLLGT